MMFCLLSAALVANMILLPCILRSPLGWFFLLGLRSRVARRRKLELFPTELDPPGSDSRRHVDPAQTVQPPRRPPALKPDREFRK
jgi:hypothetical protein